MTAETVKENTHLWLRHTLGEYACQRVMAATIPAELDMQLICRWVEAHGLEGLFYRTTAANKHLIEAGPRWHKKAMSELMANLRALKATVQLFTLLDGASIEAVAMRGVVLANRDYASPEERSMRDVDILLPPKARQHTLHVLALAGYQPCEQLRSQDVVQIGEVVLELHWSLLTAKRYRGCVDADQWLKSRSTLHTQDGCLQVLSREYELIGLVLHAFIHHELTIFKQLLDIALFMADEQLNWAWIAEWCRLSRVSRMFTLTLHLVASLFFLEAGAWCSSFPLKDSESRRLQAWIRPFFSQTGLANYVQLKANMLHAAETPERAFRQLIGFFSASELRDVRRRYSTKD